jgi:transcription elongation factor/antiterminator RfaH
MNWYAVQTQPNRENLAVAHLERQGFDVWLPCCERIVKHARQIKRVRRPLFPGYLFINFDLEAARWRTINGTIGVKNIVSFGRTPSVVDSEFITALKASESLDGFVDTGNDNLKPDQDVEILSGPMAGQIGKLLSLDAGNRVTVLLQMLGHFVRGQISRKVVVGT